MQTTNDRMTEKQVSDLLHLATELQAKAESSNDRDTAVMAYAVQKVCLELTESRLKSKASEQQLAAVVAENAGLKAENDQALQCMAEFRINLSMYKKFKYQSDVKSPATDAYLAEVRAQGVEMLLASLPTHYTARADIESFAAQLRQGAAL